MLCGRLPYEDATDIFNLQNLILNREIDFDPIPIKARPVIKKMLEKNVSKRATIDELLKDDWVTANGHETVEVDFVEPNNPHSFGNINRLLDFRSKKYGTSFKISHKCNSIEMD